MWAEQTQEASPVAVASSAEELENVLAELDELIGIDSIKDEVRGLVNFLKVQEHRKAAGLTQAALAQATGVSRKTINTVENRVFVPSTVLALKLAQVLGVQVEDLFELSGNTTRDT